MNTETGIPVFAELPVDEDIDRRSPLVEAPGQTMEGVDFIQRKCELVDIIAGLLDNVLELFGDDGLRKADFGLLLASLGLGRGADGFRPGLSLSSSHVEGRVGFALVDCGMSGEELPAKIARERVLSGAGSTAYCMVSSAIK